jgi:hypothetical protein
VIERRGKANTRQIWRPCPRCGHKHLEFSGAFYRARRKAAGLTLKEVALTISVSSPPSIQYLSHMELGRRTFQASVAKAYDQLFERRLRSGEPT